MSAALYDEALLNKIKGWVNDPKMTIMGTNETRRLFESIADMTNDRPIELPLIALTRKSTMEILNTNKQPYTHNGLKVDYSMNGNYFETPKSELDRPRVTQLNYVPIRLQYQLDIYTRYYEEAEEYVRNFIFNLINFPELQVIIPYNNANKKQSAFIDLASEVEDNSDVPERLIAGQFTRKTLSLSIDGRLYNYRTKDAAQIDISTLTNVDVKCSSKNEEN